METLLSKIFQKIQKDPHCYQAYADLLAICHMTKKTDTQLARKHLEKLSKLRATDKGLFAKVKQFFNDLIAKFRKVYEQLTPDQRMLVMFVQ